MWPELAGEAFNACGQGYCDVAAGLRPPRNGISEESRGAGSGGCQEAGQVGDGSGEIELCGGLVTPEVPGLAQTQLYQPGQAVLHRLAEVAIGCESGTALERAGGLQQGFLRVQTDLARAAQFRGNTEGTQRTGRTESRGARSPVAAA